MAERVFVVVVDDDPGYQSQRLLGVFTSREAAEARRGTITPEYLASDALVLEVELDEPMDKRLDP